jgi:hypothetical protein
LIGSRPAVAPGGLRLRLAPAGLPDPNIAPPVIAESGDPFAALRIIHLVAQVERGRPALVDDLVDRLNATYLDWLFSRRVVADTVLQLQANWMADHRSTSGIELEDGPYGPTVTLEESARIEPWLVGQAQRQARACDAALAEFGRRAPGGAAGSIDA